MLSRGLLVFVSCTFGVGARQLWANEPAAEDNIIMTAYPIGNGKLGGMFLRFKSGVTEEKQIN